MADTENVVVYKCPGCGGGIKFDSASQSMKCPYCDQTFKVDDVKAFNDAINDEKTDSFDWEEYDEKIGSGDWEEGEAAQLKTYICQSCGGEVVGSDTVAATSCPYCGNPVVLQDRVSGLLKPDYVIPFKLDKAAAKEALKRHLKGKWLLPKAFKDENKIDEITGLYVPFWLFDADADGAGRYRCTRTHHWSDANYYYTRTDYYLVLRDGEASFKKIPVDGSNKMDDAFMESIEPYDYSGLIDFDMAYLSGYLADKYDIDAKASRPRANQRVKSTMESFLRSNVGVYATCITENCSVQLDKGKVRYALLPVWMLNSTYKGKKYTFAMNGQTGKFVGNLPINVWKLIGTFAGIFAGVAAILTALLYFL